MTILEMTKKIDLLVENGKRLEARILKLENSIVGIRYKLEEVEEDTFSRKVSPAQFEALTLVPQMQKYHTWGIATVDDGRPTQCVNCGALLTECGATHDSWICPG